uniref:Uncharacterized protein n=1 Tax=uncultured bacterium pA1 TaxID=1776268 RepID=A0A0U3TQV1_9BACT|nr:hypothetical protein [uncultured bacterium pA1]
MPTATWKRFRYDARSMTGGAGPVRVFTPQVLGPGPARQRGPQNPATPAYRRRVTFVDNGMEIRPQVTGRFAPMTGPDFS